MSELNTIQCPDWFKGIMKPIAGNLPCGESLEYDAGFIMLQSRLQPKLGAEYGSFVEAAEPINWSEIERDCLGLLTRTKDIRLIITLMRCRMRQIGVQALVEGLEVLLLALEQWPDTLHPQLLDEGEFEPMMRANSFAELESPEGFLADFRQLSLPKAAGIQISIRDFEKANASPREEGALAEATLSAIQLEWLQREEISIISLQQAVLRLEELQAQLANSLGDEAPDFVRLLTILRHFGEAPVTPIEVLATPETPVPESLTAEVTSECMVPSSMSASTSPSIVVSKQKVIENRAEALSRLREIRTWFTSTEPSSPVIALLAFTEQTIGKSFVELLQFLPPELISKIDASQESTS